MPDDNQLTRLDLHRQPVSPAVVLMIRAVFFLTAATAAITALIVLRHDRQSLHSQKLYTCPMHPEVSRHEPSECPICNMALKEVLPGSTNEKSTTSDALSLSIAAEATELRRHDIVDTVRKRALPRDVRDALCPAWVENEDTIAAVLYADVVPTMAASEPATFVTTATPSKSAKLTFIADSAQRWDRSTFKVHFRIDANDVTSRVRKGDVGSVRLAPKPREVLVVPQTAVLQSPAGPYVLASSDNGITFAKRDIQLGETYQGLCISVVLSGLKERERIVARNTFFVESERRLQVSSAKQGRM